MQENDKFMRLQNQIRQNTYSVQDYVHDLVDWTEEINEKDTKVKQGEVSKPNKKLPPIRSDKLEQERIKSNKSRSYLDTVKKPAKAPQKKGEKPKVNDDVKDFKRDVTPMPTYYNKWDQFDPDAALEDVENDKNIGFDKTLTDKGTEITKTSKNPVTYQPTEYDEDMTEEEKQAKAKEDFLKGTSGAKPNTQIVVKGGKTPTPQSQIESMKKQGNIHFTSLEYEKAVE